MNLGQCVYKPFEAFLGETTSYQHSQARFEECFCSGKASGTMSVCEAEALGLGLQGLSCEFGDLRTKHERNLMR